jgi:hypothetical protein
MATAKSAVVVTPKVAKITKSDITNAILEQSLETKIGLLVVTATSDNLNKFTKDALVEIVKVANPKFEVLKKTTKGEIIPAIMKADDSRNMGNIANVIFTEENLMKLTKDVLEGIIAASQTLATEQTPAAETPAETPAAETATEDSTPTDAVVTVESVEVVAEQTETEQTEA